MAMANDLPQTDDSQALLAHLHQLLLAPVGEQPDLLALLQELVHRTHSQGAGWIAFPVQGQGVRFPLTTQGIADVTWLHQSGWPQHVVQSSTAVVLERSEGPADLVTHVTAAGNTWLLWIEPGAQRPGWTEAEAAALSVFALGLGRLLERCQPSWVAQALLTAGQQQMEMAASVSRRLAHDFGNILTGILGFTELALAQQIPTHTSLHGYLNEAYRAAQAGASFTNQLRLFASRQPLSSRKGDIEAVLRDLEATRFADRPADLLFRLEIPAHLPPVAMEAEPLRHVLGALLENSREAIHGPGAISVTVRSVTLAGPDTTHYYGDVRPGAHLEITIADTGSGLSPEAMQQLFVEPFFSTKARRRGGFGLATAYGILFSHKGGLRLQPGEERGVVARVVLPTAPSSPVSATPDVSLTAPASRTGNERLLVVEDDPEVLQFVLTTLTRAGFRPTGFLNAEEAFQDFLTNGPYPLVLSDVRMQPVSGVELARRLLRRDPLVRLVFMSGQVTAEFTQSDLSTKSFEFLAKPFRPEQLVRTVRASLDRTSRRANQLSGTK
jgi:signal transduction histidine kinase/ActR/RegA family two-component response regulator